MKITKRLMILPLLLILIIGITALICSIGHKSDVEDTITSELDLLKNLDPETAQKYISYKELFPDAEESTDTTDKVNEVFSLFFRNFDYKILDISVDKEKKTASASLRLTTIDAHALAEDFARSLLNAQILRAAESNSQNTKDITLSLEDHYLLLNHLLKTQDYAAADTECTMQLIKSENNEDIWEIKRTHSLENHLVGGLITYLSDPDNLSPEDTLSVYLDTLKKMNLDEMSSYLGVVSTLTASDTTKSTIASALVEQVHENFNYSIKSSEISGYAAVVKAQITTFDSDAILKDYQSQLDEYLASPDAVIDGSQKRYQKSLDMLLQSIESNSATTTADVNFTLTNDGVSWKLEDEGSALGDAIFGTLTTAPPDANS